MKCWVCSREAKGFSHTDTRQRVGTPARYPIDWVFCSPRCQRAFHGMYGSWVRAIDNATPAEEFMVDATELELECMRKCLKFFGEAASEIGFDKPLGSYSETEALSVINAIVTAYVTAMAQAHENEISTCPHDGQACERPHQGRCCTSAFNQPVCGHGG